MLICSVGSVVEIWLRRPKRWQFSLSGLGLLFAVVGAMLTLAKQREFLQEGISLLGMEPALGFDSLGSIDLNAVEWFAICVILCGTGCTTWTLAHGMIRIAGRLVRLVKPIAAG